jgi:hypothetical protein
MEINFLRVFFVTDAFRLCIPDKEEGFYMKELIEAYEVSDSAEMRIVEEGQVSLNVQCCRQSTN